MSEPVLKDILGNWEELYKEFRNATPSSPVWFSLVDMAVGVLISERIDAIKKQMAETTHPSS